MRIKKRPAIGRDVCSEAGYSAAGHQLVCRDFRSGKIGGIGSAVVITVTVISANKDLGVCAHQIIPITYFASHIRVGIIEQTNFRQHEVFAEENIDPITV
jgi:hypothetical protein